MRREITVAVALMLLSPSAGFSPWGVSRGVRRQLVAAQTIYDHNNPSFLRCALPPEDAPDDMDDGLDDDRAPPPDGYTYDDFGRLVVASKPRTVTEAKPTSPLMQKVVGLIGIFFLLIAAGFVMNFAFSPASPFMQD